MKYNCAILVNNQYCVDKCLLRMSIALMNSQRLELLSAVITHVRIVCVCMCTYRMLELLLTTVSSLA